MSERRESPGGEVLSGLPSTRPQRPSARRSRGAGKAPPAGGPAKGRSAGGGRAQATGGRAKAAGSRAKAPRAVRPSAATKAANKRPGDRPAEPPQGVELVGTALQAAGELAQIGLTLGTKALAGAVRRLPRP
ncbi:MAG: hypothetical protein E6G30_03910 [Actinobacteria bacterium]|nr:MAG: hypothetical protein E6G30_03910 [Actinomycetota bacterium]